MAVLGAPGCGKSTLMHAIGRGGNEMIAAGIPPNMDILLVEQEVEASDEVSALQMVVAADTKRTELLAEAKELEDLGDALKEAQRMNARATDRVAALEAERRCTWAACGFAPDGTVIAEGADDADVGSASRRPKCSANGMWRKASTKYHRKPSTKRKAKSLSASSEGVALNDT